MSIVHSFSVWLRRTFGWVTSPQSWIEIAVGLALFGAGACLVVYREVIQPVMLQAILWSVLLVIAAVMFRKGWLKLFGPVLFYDMVKSGRRGRFILIRVAYACLLFFLLFVVFQSTYEYYGYGRGTSPQRAALLAQNYFEAFMATQLIAVFLLTPAYVAGALADEKNRRTLEFLLATDLRSREIVLSKLGARMGQMAMFVLTGLPILSFLQFLGGVSPNLIIAGFVTTAITMFGLAGMSIFHSAYYNRPRNAIAVTYLTVIAYVAISFLLYIFQMVVLIPAGLVAPGGGLVMQNYGDPVSNAILPYLFQGLNQFITWFNSGNLLLVLGQVKEAAIRGTLNTQLPVLVGSYVLFHGLIGVGGILWSMFRLRPVAMRQAGKPRNKRRRLGFLGLPRPGVGNLPMLWKEMYVEGGLHFNWIGWIVVAVLVFASFTPVLYLVYAILDNQPGMRYYGNLWDWIATYMNVWIRFMTVIIGCLMLLAIAVRASTSISNERDRQTFDSLLTTPMGSNQILAAKWLGSIASVRIGWLWLGAAWFLGIISGGLHPIALPLVAGAIVVYAAFVSILGCWFSVVSRSSMRATVYTLVVTVLLAVGHWLPWMCCAFGAVFTGGRGPDRALEYIAKFQGGLTPPFVLGVLPFHSQEFRDRYHVDHFIIDMVIFSLIGLGIWLFFTSLLWAITSARFRQITHRESDILPDYQRLPQRRDLPDDALNEPIRIQPIGDSTRGAIQSKGAILLDESWESPQRRDRFDDDID